MKIFFEYDTSQRLKHKNKHDNKTSKEYSTKWDKIKSCKTYFTRTLLESAKKMSKRKR